jgi:hypothetical protein
MDSGVSARKYRRCRPGKVSVVSLPQRGSPYLGDGHVFRFEVLQGRGKVLAHQEKLVIVILFGIAECCLKWRQSENQPAVPLTICSRV